jgi:hypothetical protein
MSINKRRKTKYMFMSDHENARESHTIKIPNKPFESVSMFRYVGTESNKIAFIELRAN